MLGVEVEMLDEEDKKEQTFVGHPAMLTSRRGIQPPCADISSRSTSLLSVVK